MVPTAPLTTAVELGETWDRLAAECNIITPVVRIDSIMPMHGVSLRVVKLDPDPDGGDVYQDRVFCKPSERAPTKIGIFKLMAAAGVNVVDSSRIDDRNDPQVCEYRVEISVRDFDGTMRYFVGTKALDFRDGAAEAVKSSGAAITPGDLSSKRKHIASLCETKAIERAIRGLLTLKQKYTAAELARPFIVPKLVPMPDMSDPDAKAAMIAHTLGIEKRLAPAVAAAAAPPALQEPAAPEPEAPPAEKPAAPEAPPASGDPWDEPEAPVLPFSEEAIGTIPSNDEKRYIYANSINDLVAGVVKLGGPGAGEVLARVAKDCGINGPIGCELPDLKALGQALRQEYRKLGGK